jgi:hypothetical protein
MLFGLWIEAIQPDPSRNHSGYNAGMGTFPKSGFDFDKSPGLFFDQLECNGLGRA